jgi:drug/metabolite transporter (DMT)-like permease
MRAVLHPRLRHDLAARPIAFVQIEQCKTRQIPCAHAARAPLPATNQRAAVLAKRVRTRHGENMAFPLFSRPQRTSEADRQHRLGIALVIAAAIAWSTAPLFTRMLAFDSWTILFWRGLFGGGFIAAFLIVTQGRAGLRELTGMRADGWLVACLSALAMVTFIPALQLTSVANVAIIIAAQPFAATALAWMWFRETARLRTLLASLVAVGGVAVIVSGAAGGADVSGIALACLMMVAVAAMTVAIRRHRETSMVAAAAISNFVGALVSIPFAQGIASVSAIDIALLAMFGLFQVGLGLTFFAVGSRLLPSGQASLIATLETPLMPFWVWLAFADVPAVRALAGGALVMGAVVADIIGDNQARRGTEQAAER